MIRTSRIIILLSILAMTGASASPEEANRLKEEYKLKAEIWARDMQLATTPAGRQALAAQRPDTAAYVERMWRLISGSLREEWTLEPAAWLVRVSSPLMKADNNGMPVPAFAEQIAAIRTALETHHLTNPKVSHLCLAFGLTADTRALGTLEKIESTHPDKKVQGVAALSTAIILRTLGDSDDLMKRRISLIRKAIIESADVEFENTSVARLAEDELYVIRFLTKGRVAPDLTGTDSARRPLKLSDFKGKIVILIFWGGNSPENARTLEMANEWNAKFRDKPFALVGVNNDNEATLRELIQTGDLQWPNFHDPENQLAAEYRVGSRPLAYVLDGERRIHFAGAPGSFVELTAEALFETVKPTGGE